MKRLVGLLGIGLALAILPVLPSFDVEAQSEMLVDASIAERADAVIDATVLETLTIELDGLPHTVHKLEVDYSGLSWVSSQIYVAIPGGDRSDGTTVLLSNSAPFLNEGAEVQLALDVRSDALESAVAAASGDANAMVFTVVGGEYGVIERATSGVAAFAAGGSYAFNNFARDNFEPPTKFRVNPANSGQSASATIAAVRAGFDRWEDDPGSSVDFTYDGTTSKSGLNWGDGYTGVSWQNPSSANALGGSLAIAHLMIRGNTHEFEIVMSRAYNWTAGATSWNAYDISSVMAHEVGHGIGLAHVGTSSEIMFTHVPGGTVKPLGNGDRAGVAVLYPYVGPTCGGIVATVDMAAGTGSPTEGVDVIVGTDGDDNIQALGGDDIICAGAGNDTIDAGAGADTVFGEAGSDTIEGGSGNDVISGGETYDFLYGGIGDDVITGGNGGDYIEGGDGADEIDGGGRSDRLLGGEGNDVILGGYGNDLIYGGRGEDVIRGGWGNDRLFGQQEEDTVYGDKGHDKVYGGQSNDLLYGGEGQDRIWGETGHDRIYGQDGNDSWLDGDEHDDRVYGGDGDDVIRGGDGRDMLFGQDGNDDLHAQAGDDWATDGGPGIDICQVAPGVDKPPVDCEG